MKMNEQPIEPPDWQSFGSVDFHSAWETIQGEGPLVGTPSVFVRLAGCNLQCPICDTDYTSQRRRLSPDEMVIVVKGIRQSGLVVLTGGEPFRQNIIPLIASLIEGGYKVQIETNGILFPTQRGSMADVWYGFGFKNSFTIVCSPKTAKVNPNLIPFIDAWKYIVEAGNIDEEDGLPNSSLGYDYKPARPPKDFPKNKIFIQPLDTLVDAFMTDNNSANRKAAVKSCLQFGYRLSLQTHKLLNLP